MRSLFIIFALPLFLFSGDYYGGDGIVEIKRGEWVSGNKINLNLNDSLYFTVSNIGGLGTPQVFGAVPEPMDGNAPGLWAVIFTNPTENSITITQVDIIQPNLHPLFGGVSGIKPTTGWSMPAQNNVRWTGSIIVPPHSGFDFISFITGTGNSYLNDSIVLRVTTNSGTYTNNSFTTSSDNLLPCANISFIANGTTFYISGRYSNENNQYLLKLFESSNSAPIDSGTNLLVTIPPFFKNVTTGVNPDFLNPQITYDSTMGWTITTSLLRQLQNDSAIFNFSAVSPTVGGYSLYPFDVNFGQARAQGIVQVLPPPATGDSGQIDTISLFVICPDPMDKNTWGIWGGVLVNPTSNTILVNQFNIQAQAGNIFNGVQGVKPAAGWLKVNQNLIRWSGNIILGPYSATEFICKIKGNRKNATNILITFTASTNQGNYTATDSTTERNAAIPYANLYYLSGGAPAGYLPGISSGDNVTFTVRVAETGNFNLASGTTLEIHIPPKWSNVSALPNQSGFTPPTIIGDSTTGWTITTTTNVVLKKSFRDFQFSARAPSVAVNAHYLFPTYLINTTTNPNISSVCEAVVGVQNPSNGIIVDHTSPVFLEPNYSISGIDINLVSRASTPELGFLSIYNFNNSQFENLSLGMIDTVETSFFGSITSNIYKYLNSSNQILVRNVTTDSKTHSIGEDFLYYRISSFYVAGIDLAPSVVNRGQDSVVMMKLNFISGLGSYGIDTLRIYLSGTGVDGDISAVKLFDDLDYDGFLDPGEPQVGLTQVFNLGIATFAGTPLFTFSDVLPKSILIVYTIDALAGLGDYVGVDIMSANDILTSTHLPVPGIYPISSTQALITQGAPVIHWAYAEPESIAPDSMEITTVLAKVTDPQGPGDIQRVKIDCQPIGGDTVVLMYDDGTHGDSLPLDSIFTRDSIIVDSGVLPGSYYLEVEAMDLADTCTRTLLHLYVKDIYPPQFNTQTITDTAFCGPFVIKSEITDFSGIFTDSLYYKVNQGLFNAVSKDSISGGIYYYTIPEQSVWDTIYYYLSATDNQNNRGTDPVNAPNSLFSFVILPTAITEMKAQKEKFNIRIYPNPTRNRVNIQLTGLTNAKRIILKIYDVTGRLVKDFPRLTLNIERSTVLWDGSDDSGRRLPAGVYFMRLEAGDYKKVEKAVLLR